MVLGPSGHADRSRRRGWNAAQPGNAGGSTPLRYRWAGRQSRQTAVDIDRNASRCRERENLVKVLEEVVSAMIVACHYGAAEFSPNAE
jgi:hypothetical protein